MLGEILVGALVVVVAILVAVDISRTRNDSPHDHADSPVPGARPAVAADVRRGRVDAFQDSAGTGTAAAARDAESARRADSTGRQQPRAGAPAATRGSRRALKDWPVRSRLQLLVSIVIVAVGAAAFCIVRLVDALQGTAIHSSTSSVRDRAIASALVAGIVLIVVLALALWLAVVTAKSILKPLYEVRAGALGVAADVRRLEELRSENNGDGVPPNREPINVDSADEIGDVARAVNQMRSEVLRLAANEGALRGKLDAMFVNLSHRSQSLVERQIRLIESLEPGEQDRERRARLFRMNRIASRMHRSSQNLLILAGHVPSSDWSSQQPITLVNVIRAAVSEIEEYERISLSALPDVAVRGAAVNDVVHVLAELAENAASFSAADMLVDISSQQVNSGGVLVEITDRGVGMAEKELAYANWRLENPPAGDINIPKWMGLFVVARLAERHGIRVRLRQAEFGGLTALVWLPDDVLTYQSAATSPRRGSHSSGGGSAPDLREAASDVGYATPEPQLAAARRPEFAASRDEIRDASLSRPFIPDTGRRPGPPLLAARPQPVPQAEVPAGVRASGSGRGQEAHLLGADSGAEISGGTFDTRLASGSTVPVPKGTGQFASSPLGTAAPLNREANPADGGVIVPPVEGHPESRRLPIYDAVESHWFRGGHDTAGSPGRAAASPNRWSSSADAGWQAAEAADSPSSDGSTGAGLPRRQPNANLIPGAIPSTETVAPVRSAIAARDRLARLQRGVSEGRAAASEAGSQSGEDES
jgi:signal transduction histidine kinase